MSLLTGSNAGGGLFQVFKVFSTTWIATLAAVQVDATAFEVLAATPSTVDHGDCWVVLRIGSQGNLKVKCL